MSPGLNPSALIAEDHYDSCAVCGDQSDGHHYGVRSCRGCNAFFRRAITYNMQFICRRGGKCPVDKNARCACRACRLEKCKSVGMDARAVQPKREGNSLPVKDPYEDLILPDVPPAPPEKASRLVQRVFKYAEQKKRRQAIMCTTLEQVLAPETNVLKGIASPEDLSNVFRAQIVLCFEWASTYPEFKQFNKGDKIGILQSHILEYILLDDIFHTLQLGFRDRIVLVNNAYLAPGNFYTGADAEKYPREVIEALGGPWVSRLIDRCLIPWSEMRVSDVEMLVTRQYTFFEHFGRLTNPETLKICEKAMDTTVQEYIDYYTNECGGKEQDGLRRLGMIFDCLAGIHDSLLPFFEMIRKIPNFGLLDRWERHLNERIFILS
ncbi:unnamed protein product, partial [Mesorhabditis spiculigera]